MALAAPPSPIELGHDLADWSALPSNAPVEALSDFMQSHPDSPLAELAWKRLIAQHPQAKPPKSARKTALSHQQHQEALRRTRAAQTIARLTPSDTPTPRPTPAPKD